MNYDDACKEVGYDRRAKCPITPVIIWYAYKGGEVTEHPNRTSAMAVSRNIEECVKNKADIREWQQSQAILAGKAAELWKQRLFESYENELSTKRLELCYDKAYEDSHSDGYDAVAESFDTYVSFAKEIIKNK